MKLYENHKIWQLMSQYWKIESKVIRFLEKLPNYGNECKNCKRQETIQLTGEDGYSDNYCTECGGYVYI